MIKSRFSEWGETAEHRARLERVERTRTDRSLRIRQRQIDAQRRLKEELATMTANPFAVREGHTTR